MRKIAVYISVVLGLFIFSCKSNSGQGDVKAKDSTVVISVDENYKTVINEMKKVFESTYGENILKINYKPEIDCIRDLENDSVHMVLIGRQITSEEYKILTKQSGVTPRNNRIAYDAVAIVTNKNAADTLLTFKELQGRLNGKIIDKKIVFDGKSATSTVRYMVDSIARTTKLGSNVAAANNTDELIDAVAKSKNTYGILSYSWLSDPQDLETKKRLEKVNLVKVECEPCNSDSLKIFAAPSALTVYEGKYRLVKDITYVLKKQTDYAFRFADFLSGERGQLIFRRAHLLPAELNFNVRTTNINTNQ